MNHFLIRLWHRMKSGFYMTTSDDQLSDWTEKLQSIPQSQTCTKKWPWSLFGNLLPVWSTIIFLIQAGALHLRSKLSKSLKCTENCTACSRDWSIERAWFFCMTMPGHMLHDISNIEWIGQWSFDSSAIFTWSLLQASWQLFAGKTLPQPAGSRKCFPRVHQIPKHRFLCYKNKPTYFSLAKMCWL